MIPQGIRPRALRRGMPVVCHPAVRARRPIEWEAAAMKVTNLPYANQYVTKEYRPGYGV